MRTYYVGNQTNPDDRTKILVSDVVAMAIDRASSSARRGDHFRMTVFDNLSRQRVAIADEDCGLDCRCALRFVE